VVATTKIGGIFLTGTRDAKGDGFTRAFFVKLGKLAGHPMLVASDEEGGQVHRFAYHPAFPSAKAMGQMRPARVYRIGKRVGQAMHDNGVMVDLAPVLDIDNGKHNGVISRFDRSFGASVSNIASKARAFAHGLRQVGVRPVLKHFPGIGRATPDSNTDAHRATSPPLSSLRSRDLVPYRQILRDQPTDLVMVGNEYVRGLDLDHPASISPTVVGFLRRNIDFHGIVVTDDLRALSSYDGMTLPQNIAASVAAGVQVPLFSYTSVTVIDQAVTATIRQVPASRIRSNADRVLSLKAALRQ
jgi:beta-N-acetylhexosaminidase